MRSEQDAIELREMGAVLRRESRWILGGAAIGLALAVLLLILLPPRYEGSASVLLRSYGTGAPALGGGSSSEGGGVALGGLADLLSLDSGFETEVEILSSRAVAGEVVDSLGLQARVLDPRGWAPDSVFASARFSRNLVEGDYRFERAGSAYRVTGPEGGEWTGAPGEPLELGGAVVTLQPAGLPDEFTVRLYDFAEAVERRQKSWDVERAGGNVAELEYRASDPTTAASVTNTVIAQYLARRRTTDRGVNQRRYEFLKQHTDSIATELTAAAAALREHQEGSGLLDPEVRGEAEVTQAMELRARAQELAVEVRSLEQVMERGAADGLDARDVAAYPSLLSSPAVNNLLVRLSDLEAQRSELLERRTEQDPDVQLLTREIGDVQGQVLQLARSYHDALSRQLAEVTRELGGAQEVLASLPAQVERTYLLEREAERLAETLTALQTQLVQARLAAIAEGGDVRQIDVAEIPDEPVFPNPPLTLALGLIGGIFFGAVGAVGAGAFGRRVRDVHQAERITGAPALRLAAGVPLLLGGVEESRGLLVVSAGASGNASLVARRVAATAALRGRNVALAELESRRVAALRSGESGDRGAAVAPHAPPALDALERGGDAETGSYAVLRGNGNAAAVARSTLHELEQRFDAVIAALPPLDQPVTASVVGGARPVVLAVRLGRTTRRELESAASCLQRLGIPLAGVVLHNGDHGA